MGYYDRLTTEKNLERAYRWIQSNPDALYKNLFRNAYAAYAASSQKNLQRLRRHLTRRDYSPGHASKLFVPKPSGILRPITLLSINDQIVYQACANIIAERLHPRIRNHHGETIFGHVYAGSTSSFFYKRWTNQYKAYTKKIIQHINDNNTWIADFDLSAFYDSIDHHALRHFINEIGIDDEFCDFFFECLRKWTSANWSEKGPDIYHEHGIPQGPQASGLISEAILQHIDKRGHRGRAVQYLRYVDDIKLFAKSEQSLRQKLVSLDLASKEVGLFPQSSKINIRQTSRPEDEFKSISIPVEPATHPFAGPPTIRKRLLELIRKRPLAGQDATRFKYILARATPHHTLNDKLLKLLDRNPELGANIARYFEGYKIIPRKSAKAFEEILTRDWIYHATHAHLLMATVKNIPEPHRSVIIGYCYDRLLGVQKAFLPAQPTLKAALATWCIYHARLTFAELQTVFWSEKDWWVRHCIVPQVLEDHFGKPSLELFLQGAAQDKHPDVARAAASYLVDRQASVDAAKLNAHESAKLVFLEAGYLRTLGRPRSLVDSALCAIAKENGVSVDWRRILGGNHRRAEELARLSRKYFESNSIDACVVQLDSLLDLIFEQLFLLVRPGSNYPNYGSALNNPHMSAAFPAVYQAFSQIHQLRIKSQMAHPRHLKSGNWNRHVKHSELRKVGPVLRSAFRELKRNGF